MVKAALFAIRRFIRAFKMVLITKQALCIMYSSCCAPFKIIRRHVFRYVRCVSPDNKVPGVISKKHAMPFLIDGQQLKIRRSDTLELLCHLAVSKTYIRCSNVFSQY